MKPLNIKARNVRSGLIIAPDPRWQPKLWIGCDKFMEHVAQCGFDSVDAMSYTIEPYPHNLCINRLIYAIDHKGPMSYMIRHAKCMPTNHVKLVIGHRKDGPSKAFLGSMNITSSFNFNLMYEVRRQHVKPLVDLFEKLWNQL